MTSATALSNFPALSSLQVAINVSLGDENHSKCAPATHLYLKLTKTIIGDGTSHISKGLIPDATQLLSSVSAEDYSILKSTE